MVNVFGKGELVLLTIFTQTYYLTQEPNAQLYLRTFISPMSQSSGSETICGISQTPMVVEIHDVVVDMPGLSGICRVAVEPSLPEKIVFCWVQI